MQLKNLQENFQTFLMQSNIKNILPEIMPDERFSAQNRLKVYHDAYRIRLFEILKIDFPKTYTLMGDADFEHAFIGYLEQFPSHHFSVRYFGQHFKDFLANTAPFNQHSLLCEMATFEWLLGSTFDAPDGPLLQADTLSAISPENWPILRFNLHPSVVSSYFEWDTPQLWQVIDAEQPERPPVKQPQRVRWLLWRRGLKSYFLSCTAPEDLMFQSLQKGLDFADSCESLLEILPEEQVPQIAAQTLYKWVHEGLISKIE